MIPALMTEELVDEIREKLAAGTMDEEAIQKIARDAHVTPYVVQQIAGAPAPRKQRARKHASRRPDPTKRRRSPVALTDAIRKRTLYLLGEGYSQAEAATEVGISQQSVSRILAGSAREN